MLQVSSQVSADGAKKILRAAANHPRRATAGGALQVPEEPPPLCDEQLDAPSTPRVTPNHCQESDAVASFVREVLDMVSNDPEVRKALGKTLKESKMVAPHEPHPSLLWNADFFI